MDSFDVPSVTVDDVTAATLLLDVREDDEWAAGHIDGAIHISMGELPSRLGTEPHLQPGSPIVVVCAVGGRSAHATAWLNQNGYDASNLIGGMHAWAQAARTDRPMISHTGSAPTVL